MSQKDNTVGFQLHEILGSSRKSETESRLMDARGLVEGQGDWEEVLFNEYRISTLQDEKSYGDG